MGRPMMDWQGEENAKQWLMRDLGISQAEANRLYQLMRHYYGSGYQDYTDTREFPEKTELSEALKKLPFFSGRKLYRGMVLPDDVATSEFLKKWTAGSIQSLGKRIQSFSDDRSVSESFANWDMVMPGRTSVLLVLEGNRTIPGVAHLSFQKGEREALAPLDFEFVVVRQKVTYSIFGGRQIIYYIRDNKKK